MSIKVFINDKYNIFDLAAANSLANKTSRIVAVDDDYQVELNVVDNKKMKRINARYRGVDEVTDVLAFPFQNKQEDEFILPKNKEKLGQIFISYEKALKQAEQDNCTITEEASLLFVHGLLHLLGYDHIEESEAVKMKNLEKQILN